MRGPLTPQLGAPQESELRSAFRYWRSSGTGPSQREREILRRIATGGLHVERRGSGFSFAFNDGTTVKSRFGRFDFHKFVNLGWIEADGSAPALFPDLAPAQRYQVAPAWRLR